MNQKPNQSKSNHSGKPDLNPQSQAKAQPLAPTNPQEKTALQTLQQALANAPASRQHSFDREFRKIKRQSDAGKPQDKNISRLLKRIQNATLKRQERLKRRPHITYPLDLPVSEKRQQIADAIRDNQVVIVAGETGSGKTTQLPKICLDAALGLDRGLDGFIGHTQPRRIAARSLAQRIGQELCEEFGEASSNSNHETNRNRYTGYKVRFTDTTSPDAYVKVMTDGILLAETQRDPNLYAYDTLILDEAHERSLNIDFLIGYLKRLLPRRPDLKLIVTSATIDTERFAKHFANARGEPAPIITVQGRTYPVETRHEAPEDFELPSLEEDLPRNVIAAIDRLPQDDQDILVFMPTERDILDLHKKLREQQSKSVILPLYGRLPAQEQQKVFKLTPGKRRIVLTTNVAETSLTVPGIRYVIDTGLARVSRYAARAKVQRLPIEKVSQASCNQRTGRCGRVGPGICIRLFSQDDFDKRDAFTTPEIQRSNLAGVILKMAALELGRVDEFPFLEAPKPAWVKDAYRTLYELNAIAAPQPNQAGSNHVAQGKQTNSLTPLGQQLAKLPVDPRIGRMILAGDHENCLAEVLIIASALEAQDALVRPSDPPGEKAKADSAHQRFKHPNSDFLGYIKLWDWYHQTKIKTSRRGLETSCRQHYVSTLKMREWVDLHRQLKQTALDAGLKIHQRQLKTKTSSISSNLNDQQRIEDAIHQALLTGLLSNVAKRRDKSSEYQTASGGGGHDSATKKQSNSSTSDSSNQPILWPGSVMFQDRPKWVMCAEQVQTSRLFLRTIAPIQPQWIEPLAQHIIKKHVDQPAWHRPQGRVMAFEKTTLFGLIIREKKQVPFDKHEPEKARSLFIHHALVEGDSDLQGPWRKHNDQLIKQAKLFENKLRRRDILAEEQKRYAFFDQRIPQDIFGNVTFNTWLKKAEKTNPRLLWMNESDAFDTPIDQSIETMYPDTIKVGQASLKVDYKDAPGKANDGATLNCPLSILNQLTRNKLDWGIQGTFAERVELLIRQLPKETRKALGPAPQAAEQVANNISFGQGDPTQAIANALGHIAGTVIPANAIQIDALPDYHQINLRVLDPENKPLAEGRDLRHLRRQFQKQLAGTMVAIDHPVWNQDNITSWDFGLMPQSIDIKHDGQTVRGYPALVDETNHQKNHAQIRIALRLRQSAEQAASDHRQGLRRLLATKLKREVDWQIKQQPCFQQVAVQYAAIHQGHHAQSLAFNDQLRLLIIDRACLAGINPSDIRDAQTYEARLDAGWNKVPSACDDLAQRLPSIFELRHRVDLALNQFDQSPQAKQAAHAHGDMKYQFARLFDPGFLLSVPYEWLAQYPRYLHALLRRIEKLTRGNLKKDTEYIHTIIPAVRAFAEAEKKALRDHRPMSQIQHTRWLIEEYRVSCFAQDLGTAVGISTNKLIQAVRTLKSNN